MCKKTRTRYVVSVPAYAITTHPVLRHPLCYVCHVCLSCCPMPSSCVCMCCFLIAQMQIFRMDL